MSRGVVGYGGGMEKCGRGIEVGSSERIMVVCGSGMKITFWKKVFFKICCGNIGMKFIRNSTRELIREFIRELIMEFMRKFIPEFIGDSMVNGVFIEFFRCKKIDGFFVRCLCGACWSAVERRSLLF